MQDHEREARSRELSLWRKMPPAEKYRCMLGLVETAQRYKLARVKALHPDWPAARVEEAVRDAFLYART